MMRIITAAQTAVIDGTTYIYPVAVTDHAGEMLDATKVTTVPDPNSWVIDMTPVNPDSVRSDSSIFVLWEEE